MNSGRRLRATVLWIVSALLWAVVGRSSAQGGGGDPFVFEAKKAPPTHRVPPRTGPQLQP